MHSVMLEDERHRMKQNRPNRPRINTFTGDYRWPDGSLHLSYRPFLGLASPTLGCSSCCVAPGVDRIKSCSLMLPYQRSCPPRTIPTASRNLAAPLSGWSRRTSQTLLVAIQNLQAHTWWSSGRHSPGIAAAHVMRPFWFIFPGL